MIPDGTVWKFTFEASHAPIYVMQLECDELVGCYAPVENIDGDPARPFKMSEENVSSYVDAHHVTRNILDVDETPFAENHTIKMTDRERYLDTEHSWKTTLGEVDDPWYIIQMASGMFLAYFTLTEEMFGPPPQKVPEKVSDAEIVHRSETPFAVGE